jgi:hypothetical protein
MPGSGYPTINEQRAVVGNLVLALVVGYGGGLLAKHLHARWLE